MHDQSSIKFILTICVNFIIAVFDVAHYYTYLMDVIYKKDLLSIVEKVEEAHVTKLPIAVARNQTPDSGGQISAKKNKFHQSRA